MIVVADTGPIHYLVLSGFIGTLHDLYGVVVLPEAVRDELSHPAAPDEIRAWIAALPSWVSVRTPGSGTGFERLDPGEREALRLALEMFQSSMQLTLALRSGLNVRCPKSQTAHSTVSLISPQRD